jgi:alkanesulfonate monooxygenase SsuD/methylene tetrahydromethanopterin reductase-like flavin-dependent oxidoreductase (luciferase family)
MSNHQPQYRAAMAELAPEGPKIGITVSPHIPAGDFVGYVRRIEELGFHEVWIVEDCFLHGAFAQAATALAATSSVRVGLGIVPAAARNVAFAAMEVATLAGLHPSRLTVGVGHGIPSWLDQVGARPSSPLTLLEEYIQVLRLLLAGDEVNFDGRYVQLRGVQLAQVPPAAPPVYAGVRGPKSLQRSGRFAQGTILAEPVTPEYLAFARTQIVSADHQVVAYNLASVDYDPRVARSRVRSSLAVVGEPDWEPHVAVLDFAAELAELRRHAGSAVAFAADLPDSWVDRLAIVGRADVARERLLDLHRSGADRVALIPAGPDLFSSLDSLAQLL